jgi:hypothetical protein
MGLIGAIEHKASDIYHGAGRFVHAVGYERQWPPVQGDKWPKGYTHPPHSSSHSQPKPPLHMAHNAHTTVNFPGIFHAAIKRRG